MVEGQGGSEGSQPPHGSQEACKPRQEPANGRQEPANRGGGPQTCGGAEPPQTFLLRGATPRSRPELYINPHIFLPEHPPSTSSLSNQLNCSRRSKRPLLSCSEKYQVIAHSTSLALLFLERERTIKNQEIFKYTQIFEGIH